MNTNDFISAHLSRPMTHRVVTTYASGATKCHDVRSLAQAENWAIGESRKIGRELIDRETGGKVSVVAVEIVAL